MSKKRQGMKWPPISKSIGMVEMVTRTEVEAYLSQVQRDMETSLHKALNENVVFFFAVNKYSIIMAELRGMLKAGSDFILPALLSETNTAGRILEALNNLTVKANTIGLSLAERAPLFIPEAHEIVAGINIAVERHDLAPLRTAFIHNGGDSELSKLYTEAGKLQRETKEPLEDQWIGDQLRALVGRHSARDAAEIIVEEYETWKDKSTLQENALHLLKAQLNGNASTFRSWANRLIERAEARANNVQR